MHAERKGNNKHCLSQHMNMFFGRLYTHYDDNNNVINIERDKCFFSHVLLHIIVNRHQNERKNEILRANLLSDRDTPLYWL